MNISGIVSIIIFGFAFVSGICGISCEGVVSSQERGIEINHIFHGKKDKKFQHFIHFVARICALPPVAGTCVALIPKWHHFAGECKQFYYGGCHGNKNRFESKAECEIFCLDRHKTFKPIRYS